MYSNLFSLGKYGRLRKGSSDSPLQHNIPLSRFGQTPTPQYRIDQGTPAFEAVFNVVQGNADSRNQPAHNHWRRSLCYFLHAFLVALHLILLVVAVSHHAERRIVIPSLTEAWTTGLSGSLQVFYTLYTAILLFVTQRLMLSAVFSGPKKLTQIHDICGAWTGFGAALTVLWQQTRVASSVLSIVLVTIYFTCISVLHVTSSTLMQFKMYNDTMTGVFPAQRTWPSASVDLSSLDWMAITPLVPFLQILDNNSTAGLVNNTLYDFPGANGVLTVAASAMTLNANCGILTNLSIDPLGDGTWNVNSTMSGLDPIGITVAYPPLLSEIWLSPSIQCLEPICSTFILFLVSAEMEADDSVHGINHVYINGTYYSPGGISQNFSTPIYFVACTLNTTNHTISLEFPASPGSPQTSLSSGNQQTNATWSAFLPAGDLNLTSAISYAMKSANSLPSSPYCQPIMSNPALWANITAFNVELISTLGMDISPCHGTPPAQYASTPALLTKNQMESTISQIAAELIWLGGQLGESQGGFDKQELEYQMVTTMPLWCLNINPLPVVFALCASLILFVLMLCVLWQPHPATVSGAGVLEIMWLGSWSQALRNHLNTVKTSSLDVLRTSAMFETIFWTRTSYAQEENSDLCALSNTETCSGSFRSQGLSTGSVTIEPGSPSDLSQSIPQRMSNSSQCIRHWCYALHVMLVGLHVTLLALLVHHPEQSVIIMSASNTMVIGFGALLQAIYTIYTSVLVLLMQRLALLEIISKRRKLTTVHDVCGAWTGIGAAVYILWQQRKSFSHIRKLIPVAAYLAMMLVLHITSSSIMGWQQYIPYGIIPMDVAIPDSTVNISQLEWTEIFPVARSIAQDLGLVFTLAGLQNSTLYDVPQHRDGSTFAMGLINATTFSAQCGLVPDLTLSSQESSEGEYQIGFLDGINNGSFLEPPIWKDIVHAIAPTTECSACPQTLFYLITTGIAVDESIRDSVVVELNWTYMPLGGNPQTSTTLTYIAACSLSAQTVLVSTDTYPPIVQAPSPTSNSWSIWLPDNATNLGLGMATALSKDNAASFPMFTQGNSSANFTDMDSCIMSLLGLNLSYANTTSVTQSSADPSVTLSPWQLEDVVAQVAATFLWTAGQMGADWGGFQHSVAQSQGIDFASPLVWQLHVNALPVLFASIASFISLILAVIIIGKGPSREHPTSISGTSVLECLWLEAHSELLHSRLQMVEEPHLDALRAAGMFDICLGDIERSSYPEGEEPILELADE